MKKRDAHIIIAMFATVVSMFTVVAIMLMRILG
jgi:hypothetical protein